MKAQLKADRADEAKAVKTYGQRQKQMPAKKAMFAEMQADERDHKRRLTQALKGLRNGR